MGFLCNFMGQYSSVLRSTGGIANSVPKLGINGDSRLYGNLVDFCLPKYMHLAYGAGFLAHYFFSGAEWFCFWVAGISIFGVGLFPGQYIGVPAGEAIGR